MFIYCHLPIYGHLLIYEVDHLFASDNLLAPVPNNEKQITKEHTNNKSKKLSDNVLAPVHKLLMHYLDVRKKSRLGRGQLRQRRRCKDYEAKEKNYKTNNKRPLRDWSWIT